MKYLLIFIMLLVLIVGCDTGPTACTLDAKVCPDGSTVGRDANNNCEFRPCPSTEEPLKDVLNAECDINTECPEGYQCVSFPDIGLHCAKGNPCEYYECPEGTECGLAESYPAQLICSGPAGELPEEPVSNINTLAEYRAQIDYSCETDEDCEIKDVRNCCGYYPECVNEDASVDAELVRSLCADQGLSSVCGFVTVNSCECEDGKCVGIQ